ncbi:MAG: cellulose binding domain-containing protein [Terracidiphilus sp.]
MKNRSVFKMLAVTFAIGLAFFGMPSRAAAQSECSQTVGTTYVDALDGGLYNFQMNEYDSSLQECVDISGLGFTTTTANFSNSTDGSPATYTSLYRGCHWGDCTTSNPFPIEESNIASATTSVSITQPSGSANDAAYDIWFNQTSTTSGQPNGTEIMIWLNHQGSIQPFGSQVATATIDGSSWEVWTGNQTSWKIVSYVASTPVNSVSNLNLLPFFADSVSRGSLETSWWLIDVEYGFEIWTGGDGLAMSGFSVSAAAGGGSGGSCTTVPSAPSGLTGTAASSSAINLSWTADTAPANCTISSYNVFRSTTSGFTPSSSNRIASGVTATSYADTGLAASTTYYYVIQAVDAAGTSASSAQASATTQAAGGGGGSACTVDYTISPQGSSAFGGAVTIKNGGSTTLSNWSLTWTFANGQTIASSWNGTVSQSGAKVTVSEQSGQTWENIPAGGSYSGFGFNGTWNGTTNAIPTNFELNGTACTIN